MFFRAVDKIKRIKPLRRVVARLYGAYRIAPAFIFNYTAFRSKRFFHIKAFKDGVCGKTQHLVPVHHIIIKQTVAPNKTAVAVNNRHRHGKIYKTAAAYRAKPSCNIFKEFSGIPSCKSNANYAENNRGQRKRKLNPEKLHII